MKGLIKKLGKKGRFFRVAVVSVLTISSSTYLHAEEVNLYSARKENLIKPLLEQFTEQSGITVNLVTGKADTLLQRLKTEGKNSPADLFITVDAGRLHRAKEEGVLQPVQSKQLTKVVPDNLRDDEGYWYGLSQRARVIFYAKDRVKEEDLSDYVSLANKDLKHKICIRSSNNIYNQSLVASMIAHSGEKVTAKWLDGFVSNFARSPKGGDRDQIKAVAAGECDIAISNTYYYGQMLASKNESEKVAANKVAIFWPDQKSKGVHVNVSGVGLTKAVDEKGEARKANAIKLMEFLVSPEAQKWYAEVNYEYPVRENIKTSELVKTWGEFKPDTLALTELGKYNSAAVVLMDKAGWK